MTFDPLTGRAPAGVKLSSRPRVAEAIAEIEKTIMAETARRREREERRSAGLSRMRSRY